MDEPSSLLRGITRDDLRRLLVSGEIKDVMGSSAAVNCSRCGKPYSAHPHDAETASTMRTNGATHPLHSFRTQNDVGLWATGRKYSGLIHEPDGQWDVTSPDPAEPEMRE